MELVPRQIQEAFTPGLEERGGRAQGTNVSAGEVNRPRGFNPRSLPSLERNIRSRTHA